ncbi:MAG: helix-turn-helix domain-containing protein [Rikenellaceae bacterium]
MNEIITSETTEVANIFGALDQMIDGVERISDGYKQPFNGEIYHTDKELSERLKVSRRTTQEWRNNGLIEYVQLAGKILYPESAIQRMLTKHLREAWG